MPRPARKRPRPALALERGEGVAVVASGFAVEPEPLAAGVAWLRRRGLRVVLGEHVLARDGYFAGSDEVRAADLIDALTRPDVRAVWFARGGYGTARLLGQLPWRKLAARPRLLVGYSDLTALFAGAAERAGWPCLYGPVVVELGRPDAFDRASLRELLAGRPHTITFPARAVHREGRARGRVAGGNLSVLCHLLGTPHAPDLDGAVLFLEDVGEEVYRIDRLLTQLRDGRRLSRLAGVLLGQFRTPPPARALPDRPLRELFDETFLPLGVPVVSGLRAGHVPRKLTLPIGGLAEIDTRARTVRFVP